MKSTKNNKKEDGKLRSKHITHNPQAESARAVFGLKDELSEQNRSSAKIKNNKQKSKSINVFTFLLLILKSYCAAFIMKAE